MGCCSSKGATDQVHGEIGHKDAEHAELKSKIESLIAELALSLDEHAQAALAHNGEETRPAPAQNDDGTRPACAHTHETNELAHTQAALAHKVEDFEAVQKQIVALQALRTCTGVNSLRNGLLAVALRDLGSSSTLLDCRDITGQQLAAFRMSAFRYGSELYDRLRAEIRVADEFELFLDTARLEPYRLLFEQGCTKDGEQTITVVFQVAAELTERCYYIVNRWKTENREGRCNQMMGISGMNSYGDNVCLGAQWGRPSGNKVPWELKFATRWSPQHGQQVSEWNAVNGDYGTAGPLSVNFDGHLFWMKSRWQAGGQPRGDRMLGFMGSNVALEALWGNASHGTVPWEFLPANEWNPNTGRKESFNPFRGNAGSLGPCSTKTAGRVYWIINRWKTANGEGRRGRMLGFSGQNIILEAMWGSPSGDKVPWELIPATQFNPNTGEAQDWFPEHGPTGSPAS